MRLVDIVQGFVVLSLVTVFVVAIRKPARGLRLGLMLMPIFQAITNQSFGGEHVVRPWLTETISLCLVSPVIWVLAAAHAARWLFVESGTKVNGRNGMLLWFVGLPAFSILTAAISGYDVDIAFWGFWVGLVEPLIMCLLIRGEIRDAQSLQYAVNSLFFSIGSMMLVGVLQLLQFGLGNFTANLAMVALSRQSPLNFYMGHVNLFAPLGILTVMIPMLLTRSDIRWMRRLAYAVLGFEILAIVATFSRGAILCLVIGFVAIALFREFRPSKYAAFAVAAVAVIGLVALLQYLFVSRFGTAFTFENALQLAESDSKVTVIMGNSLQILADDPMGVGIGNFGEAWEKLTYTGNLKGMNHAHNMFLNHMIEGGIVPGLMLIGVVWVYLRKAYAVAVHSASEEFRRIAIVMFGSVLSFTIGSVVIGWHFFHITSNAFLASGEWAQTTVTNITNVYLFAILALIDAVSTLHRDRQSHTEAVIA